MKALFSLLTCANAIITEVVRVGEKNNFNMTKREFKELKKHGKVGRDFFINSNSKKIIKPGLPSIITINPNLEKFVEPRGVLSDVVAYRIKVVWGQNDRVNGAQLQAMRWVAKQKAPALITYMRFKSRKALQKYSGIESAYQHDHGYFRPVPSIQKELQVQAFAHTHDNYRVCDAKPGATFSGCSDTSTARSSPRLIQPWTLSTQTPSCAATFGGVSQRRSEVEVLNATPLCPRFWRQ